MGHFLKKQQKTKVVRLKTLLSVARKWQFSVCSFFERCESQEGQKYFLK